MRRFLRKSATKRDPLPVTMGGVRMGERVLQIGLNDPALAAALAAKAGISGEAVIVVGDERSAERARRAAENAGTLIEVKIASADALPFDGDAFDVVIVHAIDEWFAALGDRRAQMFRECHRVLRHGGRLVALESGTRSGLSALVRSAPRVDAGYEAAGGTLAAMEAAGFKPVRHLADREGYRFTEGIKG